MCKFKSPQKDKSRPVGRFLESFYSKSRAFNFRCSEHGRNLVGDTGDVSPPLF